MNDSAREIMLRYISRTVSRTDLESARGISRRYLWTDAFAVCNFLGFFEQEHDEESLAIALRLVDEVHRVLGRHRVDDARRGWISGFDDEQAARHPTAGGLRIGKQLPERQPDEPYDPTLEWERDGQYFHYLTRWMHALDRVARVTGDAEIGRWSVELAQRAHAGFVVRDSRGRATGLHWKMSIDLSRPLVPSMGQHDPLDGFVTVQCLQADWGKTIDGDLGREIHELRAIFGGEVGWTDDALGIGGLLVDATVLARLIGEVGVDETDLLESLLETSLSGLEVLAQRRFLEAPSSFRLPFREFGLAIGLQAVSCLEAYWEDADGALRGHDRLRALLDSLGRYVAWTSTIEEFWLEPEHRRSSNWTGHRDINEVMLATSLAPHGYLGVPRPSTSA